MPLRRGLIGLTAAMMVAVGALPAEPAQAGPPTVAGVQARYGTLNSRRAVDVRKLPNPGRGQRPAARPLLVPDQASFENGKRLAELDKTGTPGVPFSRAPRLGSTADSANMVPPTSITTFPGMSKAQQVAQFGADQNVEPPDSQIAAGPDRLLEMVNSSGSVWTKSGTLVKLFDLNGFFDLASQLLFGDPRVIYDPTSGRFVASAMGISPSVGSAVYVAMSTTSDPAGTWTSYLVASSTGGVVFDQPKLSATTDKLVVAWQDFDCTARCAFTGAETWVLQKSDVAAGSSQVARVQFGPAASQFGIVPAIELAPASTAYLLYSASLSMRVVLIDGTPGAHNVTWSEQSHNSSPTGANPPPDAAQPEGAPLLATGDDRFVSAVWKNDYLWAASTVPCTFVGDQTTRSCVSWTLVSTVTFPPQPVQGGTFGEAGAYVFYPAVSLDSAGNPIFVFSESSIHMYPSVVSLAGTGPSRTGLVLHAGLESYDSTSCGFQNRWGDYSGAATDPLDPSRVWLAGEDTPSATDPCNWGTTIGEVRFTPVPKVTSLSPDNGSTVGGTAVTITGTGFTGATSVKFGAVPASGYTVDSDTQITAISPPSPGYGAASTPVRVVVDTPGGTSDDPFGNVPLFTYNAPKPVISGIMPASGTSAGGTIITVAGSGFTAATSVGFGNPQSPGTVVRVPRSNFLSSSDTVIVVPSPARPPGLVDVVVTTAGGENAATAADQFTFVKPAGGAPGSGARVAGGGLGSGAATAIGHYPTSVALSGNTLYIADSGTSANFPISAIHALNLQTGIETPVAGTGFDGFSGDGGPASAAQISGPKAMVVDGNGNLFFVDSGNNRIRKISANGVISTVTTAMNDPYGLAVDAANNLYVADSRNNLVRMISATTGAITTVAGGGPGGFTGDGGPATSASLWFPTSVFVDSVGNLFIADYTNSRVRRVDHTTKIITTVAGTGNNNTSGDGGLALLAGMAPMRVFLNAAGDLFILDSWNETDRVRRVDHVTQIITTVAGTGVPGYNGDGIAATTAKLYVPSDILVDGTGNLYIADTFNDRVRRVDTSGIITTIAGTGRRCGWAGDNGPATAAQLCTPDGLVADAAGNLYIADADNNRIRKLATDGTITTFAGTGTAGLSGDGGLATAATLNHPINLAMDHAGKLYLADMGNHRIRVVDAGGHISTIAGTTQGFAGDGGPALQAQLNNPQGLALDSAGNLYVADNGNNRVRKVDHTTQTITTIAGTGTAGFAGDYGPATQAQLNSPQGLAVDAGDRLYIADTLNGRIRQVDLAGHINTVAGNPQSGSTDQVPATNARLWGPMDVAIRPGSQTILIADQTGGVKEVAPDGTLVQIAGGGYSWMGPWDDGPALGLPIGFAVGVTVDGAGNLFVADAGRHLIDRVLPPAVPTSPAPVTATAGTGSASVSWIALSNGGSPVISYTVTPFIGTAAQAAGTTVVRGNGSAPPTSVTISGLRHATYTFQVVATNPVGNSAPSSSNAVTPRTAPGAPTNVQAVPTDGAAMVTWSAPADDGGSPVTGYTIESSPSGGLAGTLGKTASRVPDLTNGAAYTFVVRAINALGAGDPSAASNTVHPFAGGTYHAVPPVRILDTRDGTGGFPKAPLGQGKSIDVFVTGIAGTGVPSTGVSAVVLNVTVTGTTASSFLTLYPTGVRQPTASNLNWTRGGTVANLVEVAVGKHGQVTAYNAQGTADVIADVAGWVGVTDNSRGADGLFNPVVPARLLDTRNGTGTNGVGPLGPGGVIHLQVTGRGGVHAVPEVSAVVLNLTVANATAPSYLTAFPTGAGQPVASNLNFAPRQVVANRVIVKVGTGGQVDIYNAQGSVNVIADVGGWFTDASSTQGGSHFVGITPTRLLDTRDGAGPLGSGATGVLSLTGPGAAQVQAIVVNVTAVNPTAASYLTVWPDGEPQPTASDVNFIAGLVVPNLVVVKVGTNAGIDIYNALGSTHVIVDLVGYYGAPVPAPSSLQLSPHALRLPRGTRN